MEHNQSKNGQGFDSNIYIPTSEEFDSVMKEKYSRRSSSLVSDVTNVDELKEIMNQERDLLPFTEVFDFKSLYLQVKQEMLDLLMNNSEFATSNQLRGKICSLLYTNTSLLLLELKEKEKLKIDQLNQENKPTKEKNNELSEEEKLTEEKDLLKREIAEIDSTEEPKLLELEEKKELQKKNELDKIKELSEEKELEKRDTLNEEKDIQKKKVTQTDKILNISAPEFVPSNKILNISAPEFVPSKALNRTAVSQEDMATEFVSSGFSRPLFGTTASPQYMAPRANQFPNTAISSPTIPPLPTHNPCRIVRRINRDIGKGEKHGLYRTELCINYMKEKSCVKGEDCPRAHSFSQLRARVCLTGTDCGKKDCDKVHLLFGEDHDD